MSKPNSNPFSSCSEKASEWGISVRRISKLCTEGRIPGATKISRIWFIPSDAEKPKDNRNPKNAEFKTSKEMAEKWGISSETVAKYCRDNYIPGAIREKGTWKIPVNTKNPARVGGRTIREQAKVWGVPAGRVSALCKEGAIKGAEKRGARWIIPFDAALPQDDYISVKEFAKRNGISARTTLKMCHSGAIVGAQKSGKAWKIPDAAAAAFGQAPG